MGIRNFVIAYSVVLGVASGCQFSVSDKSDRLKLDAIGDAVVNYREIHGHLPPILYSDETGRPLHSWRVMLVPYITANGFYSTYDFRVAWNEGRNVELMNGSRFLPGDKFPYPASVRHVFQSSDVIEDHETSFVAVIRGELQAQPCRLLSGVESLAHQDRTHKNFLIVELSDSGIHWMEPRDVCLTEDNNLGSVPFADVRDRIVRGIEIGSDVTHLDREATLTYLDNLAVPGR